MNGSVFHSLIAVEWTEGRLRLDSLVRLINVLNETLKQDVEALSELDPSAPSCEEEARERTSPTLRRFTFDQRIRDECRSLIRLLQFCGEDLSRSYGLDTTHQLHVLASIDAAIEAAERG
jgi:hypothetical protein